VVTNKRLNVSSGILFLALLGGCSANGVSQTEMNHPQANVTNTPVVVVEKAIKKKTVERVPVRRKIIEQKRIIVQRSIVPRSKPVVSNAQRVQKQQLAQQRAAQKQWLAQQKIAKQRAAQQLAAKKRQLQQQRQYAANRHRAYKAPQRKYSAPPRRAVRQAPIVKRLPQRSYAPQQHVVRKSPSRVYVSPQTVAIRQYQSQPRTQQPQYRKASLTGDFANNSRARRFIDKMVSRHGFERGHLNGLLSNARATSWMRKMAAKDERPRTRRKKSSRTPSWTRYRSHFITSRHINAGVAFYRKHRHALERAERQFGVPKEYIMGILGVETIFGGNVGKNRAIDALTTMAFMNSRRGRYFESELESYLLMTRSTRLNPLTPKASYAGALGLSQFMPSNIKKYGVDFDGDGGVNLWKPDDAIASIAKYFKRHGWRTGEMVAVPARSRGTRYRSLKVGYKYKYSPSRLSSKGITARYKHNMRGSLRFIKLNARGGDELWVGGQNFYVITRYNHSTHYAMAVHQLAQAIKQRVEPSSQRRMISPKIAPTNKRPISVEEAMELLSASNDRKDAVVELRELIAKESEA
jgi:membrane-bound lytic murein transglycosylase B